MLLISLNCNRSTSTAMKATYAWKINAGVATNHHLKTTAEIPEL